MKEPIDHNPATCHVCQRHAIGIGLHHRPTNINDNGIRWLCAECALLAESLQNVKRFDAYELKALDGAVDAVGDFIDTIGGKVDLGEYDELERRMLCKAAVQGFGDRLRKLIRDGEAPW